MIFLIFDENAADRNKMALTLPSGSKFGTPKEKNTIIDYFLFQYRTPIYSAIWRNWENECFDELLSWKADPAVMN